jgi:ABC-type glycerol-3-phosphate transport system substrate-binding protein
MRRHKLFKVSVGIVLGGLLLAACNREGQKPAAVEKLAPVQLLVRTGPEADGLKVVAQAFTKRTGIVVQVNTMGRDTYMSSMPAQLLARSSSTDVFFVPSTMVGEFAAAGALEPLDGYVRGDDDLLVRYGYNNRVYALPTDVSTLFLFYRKDLIATPPGTWDELFRVAQQFTRSSNPASPTKYGLGFSGKGPEEPPKVFYPILWSMGGDVLDGSRVRIDSPQSVNAARYYQSLVTGGVAPVEVTTWSYPEVVQALERGEIAMAAPMWNAAYADIRGSSSQFHNMIEVAAVPGVLTNGQVRRVDFQHGWTLVLNAQSHRKPDAAQFIAFATGREGGHLYAVAGGTPARKSLLGAKDLQAARPEFKLVLEMLQVARAEPVVPYYNDMHSTMNGMLTKLLLKQQTPEDATGEAGAALRKVSKLP